MSHNKKLLVVNQLSNKVSMVLSAYYIRPSSVKKWMLSSFYLLPTFMLMACVQQAQTNYLPSSQTLSFEQKQLQYQFIEAVKKGDLAEIKDSYKDNVDINQIDQHGRVALIEAIKFDQIEALNFLINNHANINLLVNNMTPLMWATYYNNIMAIHILIKTEAEINAVNSTSWTALHYAALLGRTQITQELIKADADINAASVTGMTALMKSAGLNHYKNLILLVEQGAEINLADNKGRTALMYAAAMGRVEAFKILTSMDANLAIVDRDGKTAINLAEDRKKKGIISYLNKMRQ